MRRSLNPCFNGRCTRTMTFIPLSNDSTVLILVLMEDALVHILGQRVDTQVGCLNPCFNGRCTRT